MRRKTNYFTWLLVAAVFFLSCNSGEEKNSGGADSATVATTDWKIGVALFSFHRHPFATALAMADSAGVKNVEGFSFYKLGAEFHDSTMGTLNKEDQARMKQMLDAKGIRMSSLYVEGPKNAEDWKHYFDMAKQFGMEYLVSEPPKDQWDMIDSLAGLYKVKMAIHEHSKELSKYWHPDSVLAAIKGHENIGACADIGHWARSGLDPVKCLEQLAGHVYGMHLKDIDEMNNPQARDVNPGTGVIDFAGVVKELRRQHFSGTIDIECEHNLDNNLPDVKEGIRYFNGVAK